MQNKIFSPRLIVYSYLPSDLVLTKLSKLSSSERALIRDSTIIPKVDWVINCFEESRISNKTLDYLLHLRQRLIIRV